MASQKLMSNHKSEKCLDLSKQASVCGTKGRGKYPSKMSITCNRLL